ncbi:uncharacterized protein LOC108475155 [Gossypium arboreum]|uniref:uncharacterized protein LOC108475155 n=1 Tax=Gossypium arboreum TaxID=29729 RepID=UPI0008195EC1|nr:uncharacterized protein LOC108475155 [Gossypium arboreum]
MLRILERVSRPNTSFGGCGSITKRLRSNGADVFRGIAKVASNEAEYWMEATERIMDDLKFTTEQKFRGAVSLLRDESYQGWLTVKEGIQPDWLTWDLFKMAFQSKYVEASYIDAKSCEFLNLTVGDRSVTEYEAEFLRLSRYVRGMVATEYEHCVHFEDDIKDNLRMLIAPQREREFAVLVKKAKIAKEVKCTERQNRDREKAKRDTKPSNSGMKPRKIARTDGPVRVGLITAPSRVTIYHHCNRRHLGECWRATGACLRCGSTEHRVKDYLLRINQIQAPTIETE